jgi:hypothetical protein
MSNRAQTEQAFKSNLLSTEGPDAGVPQEFNERSEVYMVRRSVWERAGMADFGGCLCIGCLESEKRLGRQLMPKDFPKHPFNDISVGTVRLLSRQVGYGILKHHTGMYAVCGGQPTPVKNMEEAEEVMGKWFTALTDEERRKWGVEMGEELAKGETNA